MASARWRMCAATAASSSPGTATRSSSGRSSPRKSPMRCGRTARARWRDLLPRTGRPDELQAPAVPAGLAILLRLRRALRSRARTFTGLPLLERKRRLLAIMPAVECRLLYLDHLAGARPRSVPRGLRARPRRDRREVGERHLPHRRPRHVVAEDQESATIRRSLTDTTCSPTDIGTRAGPASRPDGLTGYPLRALSSTGIWSRCRRRVRHHAGESDSAGHGDAVLAKLCRSEGPS